MSVHILTGDCRAILPTLPADSFHCCVTSPPYFGLRDYGVEGQIGLEATLDAYLSEVVAVCREVRRVLRPDGTFWLNIGDGYAANRSYQVSQSKHRGHDFGRSNAQKVPVGLKPKDLMLVPARLALALQADGWWVRSEIIWHKPNPMPESVTDRPTSAHEKIWLLTKSERYYFDAASIKEKVSVLGWDDGSRVFGGKNKHGANVQHGSRTTGRLAVSNERKDFTSATYSRHRSAIAGGQSLQAEPDGTRNARNVWTIATQPFAEAHFATMAPELAERCIKAGCPVGGTVLDPFGGAGTTGLVADRLQRNATLIELNAAYADMAAARLGRDAPLFSEAAE